MDVDVDLKMLSFIQSRLKDCQKLLDSASIELSNAVTNAGQSLEGKQYSLSVETTKNSCEIINASAKNLSLLWDYIDCLEAHLTEYLECKYKG